MKRKESVQRVGKTGVRKGQKVQRRKEKRCIYVYIQDGLDNCTADYCWSSERHGYA